jgi:hypothetical protein
MHGPSIQRAQTIRKTPYLYRAIPIPKVVQDSTSCALRSSIQHQGPQGGSNAIRNRVTLVQHQSSALNVNLTLQWFPQNLQIFTYLSTYPCSSVHTPHISDALTLYLHAQLLYSLVLYPKDTQFHAYECSGKRV